MMPFISRAAFMPAVPAFFVLVFAGCGPKPIYRTGSLKPSTARVEDSSPEPLPTPSGPVETALSAAADTWIGVPYRYGGASRSGVDCSALAAQLLEEVGVSLPRSVSAQRDVGREIDRGEVEAGDLVFFRLESSQVNHVGVALDDARFVHASRSRGVAIDRLDDNYYGRHVAETRRVFEHTSEAVFEVREAAP